MCAIAGIVNCGNPRILTSIIEIQAHRGPDDSGVWETQTSDGGWVGLGSRRLAILDLSPAGHMPMSTQDGALTIVFNGEIYNYPQLRRELEAKGYQFRSNSDTEVILYLYREEGENCATKLNGMFSIAIWDANRQQLWLARDHFGIKPLYYCLLSGGLVFASEIKAILQHPDVSRRVDPQALQQFLTLLWTPDPLTMFAGVKKLLPGHWATFNGRDLCIKQYWDLRVPPADHSFEVNETQLVDELRMRFENTVRSQMLSDVPIGAFLSAGLDSSSIVAAMARHSSEPVRTFTIAFPDKYRHGEITLDDTQVARRTAEHFKCLHTEIVVEPNVVSLLPKLVWYMDEPTADPALIAAYLVNQEARSRATVLLSGVGGDELFAGYRKYQAHYIAQSYQRFPGLLREKVIEPLVRRLPSFRNTSIKGYVRLAKKMARSGSMEPVDRFLTDSMYLSERQRHQLLLEERVKDGVGFDPLYQHRAHFTRVSDADFLNQMMYVDIKTFMMSLNLTYNDKMSMASSVEVRVPFLDKDFVEWVNWNISPRLKLHDGTPKYILRQAMKSLLPPEVLRQKKAGFGAPIDYWLANDLREMTDDLLSETAVKRRGLFNHVMVRKLIDEHRRGREDWSLQIWQLLTLELWAKSFLD